MWRRAKAILTITPTIYLQKEKWAVVLPKTNMSPMT